MMRIVAIVGGLVVGLLGLFMSVCGGGFLASMGYDTLRNLFGRIAILALSMDCSFCYYQRDPWRWASLCVGLRTEFCGNSQGQVTMPRQNRGSPIFG